MQNTEAKPEHKKKSRRKKWLKRVIIGLAVLIVAFGLLAYFFFADLIKTTLYDFVLVESKKVYKLNFDEIDYQFRNSTLTIKGVRLQPDTSRYKSLVKEGGKQKPLYDLKIDEIQLQGFNIRELYYEDRLEIEKFLVKNPVVDQIGIHQEEVSKPHKKFIDVLRNVSNKYLEETTINEIVLKNGNFGFYRALGDTITDAGVDGISIYLKQFRINGDTAATGKKILFSEDIELNLEKIEAILINNSHWLTIDSISLSSIDSSLSTHGVKVQPIEALQKSRGAKDKLLIKLDIPETSFVNVDINSLFFEEYLLSDSLIFRKPILKIYGQAAAASTRSSGQRIDKQYIYELFSGFLNGFDVDHLYLENGDYTSFSSLNDSLPRTQAERIAFKMSGIRIDSAHLQESQKLIIADEASLLADSIITHLHKFRHRLTLESIDIDSRTSSLNLKGIMLKPEGNPENQVKAEMPGLSVSDVNFRKLLNSGEIIAKGVYIEKPDINANIFLNGRNNGDAGHIGNSVSMIAFDSLFLDSCSYEISLKDSAGVIHSKLQSRLLLLQLLNDTIDFSQISFFDMESINLLQEDFSYSIHSINRKIQAGQLKVSSIDSVVYLQNASMIPVYESPEYAAKNSLPTRVDIPELKLNRIDPFQYLRNKKLIAADLIISDPFLELTNMAESEGGSVITKEVLHEKINGIFNLAAIPRVRVKNLRLDFPGMDTVDMLQIIGEQGVGIEIDGFYFSENLPGADRFLFSEDIRLNIKDLTLPFKNSTYHLTVKDINASTMEGDIKLTGLKLNEWEKESLSLDLPRFEINRIDFDKLLYERQLQISSVDLLAPDIHLQLQKSSKRNSTFLLQYPDFFESTSIDSISITYGEVHLENFNGNPGKLKSDFDFRMRDIYLEKGMTYSLGKDPLITDQIELKLNKLTSTLDNGFYSFSLSDASISVDDGRIALHELSFHPVDEQQAVDLMRKDSIKQIFSGEIPRAVFEGISFDKLVTSGGLIMDSIVFDQTDISLYSLSMPEGIQEKKESGELHLPVNMPVVSVSKVDFGSVNFELQQVYADSIKSMDLDGISLKINRLYLDSANISGPHKFMYADDIELEKDHYGFNTSDSMYSVYLGKLSISTAEQRITLDSLSLRPRYEKYKFARRVGHQTDRMVLSAEDLSINTLDFRALTQNNSLRSGRIDVGSFQFEAFRDKSVPFPEDQRRGMPRQMLKQIPIETLIDTIVLSKGKITYGERMHEGWSDGEVVLEDFNGTLTGLKNDWSDEDTLVAEVDFKLMGEADANIKLDIPLGSEADTFMMRGGLNRMDLSAFNSMTRNLFGVAIKKGKGEVEDIRMHGNAESVSGELIFPFRKFKIQLINPQTGERGGIGDGIMTFLANEILLRSNNPRFLRKIRVGTIYAPRDPKRSIFNYIWKGILSGIESTLGYSNKEQRQQRRELRKQQRKEN